MSYGSLFNNYRHYNLRFWFINNFATVLLLFTLIKNWINQCHRIIRLSHKDCLSSGSTHPTWCLRIITIEEAPSFTLAWGLIAVLQSLGPTMIHSRSCLSWWQLYCLFRYNDTIGKGFKLPIWSLCLWLQTISVSRSS